MFPFTITVNKFLGLTASKTLQVINFLDRGHVDIPYHPFKRCFPWVKKRGVSAENVWVAFRQVLSRESGNYLLVY